MPHVGNLRIAFEHSDVVDDRLQGCHLACLEKLLETLGFRRLFGEKTCERRQIWLAEQIRVYLGSVPHDRLQQGIDFVNVSRLLLVNLVRAFTDNPNLPHPH